MPVLVESDAVRAAELTTAQGSALGIVIDDLGKLEQALADDGGYAVVVGPTIPLETAGHLAQALLHSHPGCTVVLVRDELSTQVFSYAMSVGIPVVLAGDDSQGLHTALERSRITWEAVHGAAREPVAAPAPTTPTEGKVVTVFSPKGGVGKTTVSVNLAMALSSGGAKVCVVDLDLAFGDVAITLQVIPKHSIDAAIGVGDNLDFSLLSTLLTKYDDQVTLLAAPTTPDVKDRVPPALILQVISTLRRHFDYVVVDTSPGFEDAVLQALDLTDELALICTLDVPTVKNLKMAIETLNLLNLVPKGRHLIVNRADAEIGLSLSNVEDILGMKVSASLPSEIEVAHATNRGIPLVKAKPDHPISRTLLDLASRIARTELTTTATAPAPKKRRLFSRR